jgi:2-methylcitrate dehydratase PrpD
MFGSHTKSFHPGRAAQSGLMAAVLAQGGYTSSEQALEAKRGWANVVGVTKRDLAESMQKWMGMESASEEGALGLPNSKGIGRWEILRNSFKPYPCGIVIHPIIDGCAQIHNDMKKQGLDVKNMKSVFAKVHPLVLELTGKRKPRDGLEGKFSVYHGAAIGLLYGKGTPSVYEDHVVQDPAVIGVRDKVDAEADKTLGADETKIVLTMKDGKVLEKHIKHAVGSLEVPMDDQMLQQKFTDQCVAVLGDGLKLASDALWNIENVDDVADITKVL